MVQNNYRLSTGDRIILITYFRSSSYNTFNNCENQYFCQYVLSLDNPATKAATLGNVCHKALECIALSKVCQQENRDGFEEENLGYLSVSDCDPDHLIEISFEWHRKYFEHANWNDIKDLRDCRTWLWMVLNDPIYDPRRRSIIKAEQKFDFEIEQPWAKYDYTLSNGQILSGYLSLKGTMDLVTETLPGCIEVIDWKTGASRNDFATGKEKDFDSLHTDAQLRLYHYACHRLFPDKKDITMTIYFVRVGGPFSLMLGPDDLEETENIIRKQFDRIRNTLQPQLNPGPEWSNNPRPFLANFKCHKLCAFSKPDEFSDGKPVCQFIKEEIQRVGIEKVTEKFGDLSKLSLYSDGGGRYSDKQEK